MITKIETILEYLTTMVSGLSAFSNYTVMRDVYQTIPSNQLPVINIFPVKDIKDSMDEYLDSYIELRLLTVAFAIRTTQFPVSKITIPFLDAICEAIKANPSLNNLVLETKIHTISWSGDNDGDGKIASAGLVIEILYRTN